MELNMFLKNYLRAVFILALIFTGLDPGGLKSQCIDVHSSPCYVNIGDIPYSKLRETIFSTQPENFYEEIKGDSIYADTCNPFWIYGDYYLYYREFYMVIQDSIFKGNIKIGDSNLTKADIKDEFVITKIMLDEFESKFCKISFKIIINDTNAYTVIARLERHVQDSIMIYYWDKIDSLSHYFICHGGKKIVDPNVNVNDNNKNNNVYLKKADEDNIIIYSVDLIEEQNIEIYDLLGIRHINTIARGSETIINISALERGLYFIKYNKQILKFIRE